MESAKARFRLSGTKGSLEGLALVDTGSLMCVVDEEAADRLGLKPTGRKLKLTTLSGGEVMCGEMISEFLELEGEKLVSERVAVCSLPGSVKGKLEAMDVSPNVIIGVITLEAAGLTVNPLTGELEKLGWLSL